MSGSRSNSTDSDYELMQHAPIMVPPQAVDNQRQQRGYSIRNQDNYPQTHQYPVPLSSRFARFSPNRWRHFPQLSARSRNYAGLHNQGHSSQPEGEYAVPCRNRYDGFFRGSIREEHGTSWEGEEDEHQQSNESIGKMTIVSETSESCWKTCYKPFLLFLFVSFLLSTSLSGLGLALYNKFSHDAMDSGSSHNTMTCVETNMCGMVVTMTEHAVQNCTTECTTESITHNISGLTPIRFYCAASCDRTPSYDNIMYSDGDMAHCVCSFPPNTTSTCHCTVVGDYCMMTEDIENGTNT